MIKFKERLHELRLEMKLSKCKLARELKVSHTTIKRWENGEVSPTLEYIFAMCKFFKVSSDYLIGLKDFE